MKDPMKVLTDLEWKVISEGVDRLQDKCVTLIEADDLPPKVSAAVKALVQLHYDLECVVDAVEHVVL